MIRRAGLGRAIRRSPGAILELPMLNDCPGPDLYPSLMVETASLKEKGIRNLVWGDDGLGVCETGSRPIELSIPTVVPTMFEKVSHQRPTG